VKIVILGLKQNDPNVVSLHWRQFMMGSFAGAAASEKVTEANKGIFKLFRLSGECWH